MTGRHVTVEPLTAAHGDALFSAPTQDTKVPVRTYLPDGPYADKATFADRVARAAAADDPVMHAILIDSDPLGHASFPRIDPANAVIEVGFINSSHFDGNAWPPQPRRVFLMMAHAFDEFGYRRHA